VYAVIQTGNGRCSVAVEMAVKYMYQAACEEII